jgi:endonuclease/exonuclease/phosphatase family metal-dependent hydrolase
VLLKFDTQNPIPAGSSIASARLTITVAGGNSETRTLTAYRIASSYEETQTTWNVRSASAAWGTAGGDLAERVGTATVTGTVGSDVTFDVTALVQNAVNGNYGSRYTRLAIVDGGASSQGSYKQYYSDETVDPGVRPTLSVTLGTAPAPAPAPDSTTTTGVRLRVLQWNIHHGVGTDGRYDINRLATWMARMTPDVITINEAEKYTSWGNEDQPARFKTLMEQKTGRTWYMHFTQEFGQWSSNGKGHIILSVYPFQSTGHTTLTASSGLNGAGAVGEARIVVNGRTVTIVVSHLDPSSSTMRLTQAKQTIAYALSFPENRIVTGDMNAWPDQSSIAEFNKTYNDSWAVAESRGLAVQFAGLSPSGATKKGRIDYIFYSKYASNLVIRQSQVYDTRDASGYMPSDHRPVVTTFEVR